MATIKGKTPVSKASIKKAAAADNRKTEAKADPQGTNQGGNKTQVTKRADQAPEAKRAPKEQSAAAERMFKDADEAQRRGLPVDLTREQHENQVRRAALGF